MAAMLLMARRKVPVSFEDVSLYFTKTEWKLLDLRQRMLYKRVMLENYRHLVSLGFSSICSLHQATESPGRRGPGLGEIGKELGQAPPLHPCLRGCRRSFCSVSSFRLYRFHLSHLTPQKETSFFPLVVFDPYQADLGFPGEVVDSSVESGIRNRDICCV
ncbi:zinc finger protein 620-like [Mesoplodon densirostris]|uniref:zinc finger protein 620-like n=1 Tax=Mesoplodon densirostris TaxID=48708 RepID=UPI0028DCC2FB|nr:zinc finger protein 620-like [Mesoplodon densirostris]XP_059943499.1 zinc finger protein 620-like [Mesoplodon densirostris]